MEEEQLFDVLPNAKVYVTGIGTQAVSKRSGPEDEYSAFQIVSVSRLATKKRIDLLVQLIGELTKRGELVHLHIAGTGPLEQELKNLTEQHGVTDRVTFHGHIGGDTKSKLYRRGDLFALLSEDENFGISVAEALAHGIPVLLSKNVGAAEYLDREAGRVLSTLDVAAACDFVLQLIHDRTRWASMKNAARENAAKSYTWDAVIDRWEEMMISAEVTDR